MRGQARFKGVGVLWASLISEVLNILCAVLCCVTQVSGEVAAPPAEHWREVVRRMRLTDTQLLHVKVRVVLMIRWPCFDDEVLCKDGMYMLQGMEGQCVAHEVY